MRRPAIVTWRDAHSDRNGSWCDRADIDDDPYIVVSCGWLLDPPKSDHVSLVQSIGDDDALDHILHVPIGMVVNVEHLGVLP